MRGTESFIVFYFVCIGLAHKMRVDAGSFSEKDTMFVQELVAYLQSLVSSGCSDFVKTNRTVLALFVSLFARLKIVKTGLFLYRPVLTLYQHKLMKKKL